VRENEFQNECENENEFHQNEFQAMWVVLATIKTWTWIWTWEWKWWENKMD